MISNHTQIEDRDLKAISAVSLSSTPIQYQPLTVSKICETY